MGATFSLPQHSSVYQIVTEKIIRQLESGVAPWRKPWTTGAPVNLVSKREYSGLNVILLASQGYGSPYWLTFNQAKALGGHVKQGEHASLITFWKFDKKPRVNLESNKLEEKTIPLLRYFNVFNVEQCEGFSCLLGESRKVESAEAIVSGIPNPPKRTQSCKAFYRPSDDTVGMPSQTAFDSSEAFYSTLFHELTHSTGHASRVGREGIEHIEQFGSETYSKEELVAELGASMLCGVCGIAPATIESSASYLKAWIDVLKGDSRLIVSAASAAQKAANYIRGFSVAETGESASA